MLQFVFANCSLQMCFASLRGPNRCKTQEVLTVAKVQEVLTVVKVQEVLTDAETQEVLTVVEVQPKKSQQM